MDIDLSIFKYDGKKIRKKLNLSNKVTPDLAEIVGIILGDGGIYLDKKNKFHVTVAFHKQEISYLRYVKNLLESYFSPYKFYISELECEFLLKNVSVCIGNVLLFVGLKAGNKVKNGVEIPKWVFTNKIFIKRTLRGLFDTDGCVYRKYHDYAQIQFKFSCKSLVKSVRISLIQLGYNPTKIHNDLNKKGLLAWKFYLSRQDEIDKFFNEINPRNIKYWNRYNNIKNGDTGIRISEMTHV